MTRFGAAAALVALSLARPLALGAQTEPRLAAAVRLAQEGKGDSARTMVQRVLTATDPRDSLYPQVLYAKAVIAANPDDMRRDLQRVAVEYSASSWADDALFRLAQLDVATGDLDGATRDLERLRLDFSSSTLYAQAALWAARVYFEQRKPPAACRWLAEGLARTGSDVELRNQLEYYNQRCAGVVPDTAARADSAQVAHADSTPTGPGDSARAVASGAPASAGADSTPAPAGVAARDTTRPAQHPAAGAAAPPQPGPARPDFRIQVAAVNTRQAADAIKTRVKAAGLDAIVVAEKGLFKVRAGAFRTRAEAQAALPAVRAKLGGQPFVVAGP